MRKPGILLNIKSENFTLSENKTYVETRNGTFEIKWMRFHVGNVNYLHITSFLTFLTNKCKVYLVACTNFTRKPNRVLIYTYLK